MLLNFKSNYDSLPHKYGVSNKTVNLYFDNKVLLVEDDVSDPVAVMVEPRSIFPNEYQWLEENYTKFKYIFTFDSKLLELPNALLLIYGQISAEYPEMPKTKNISMVASDKDFCEGHRNRQKVAQTLKGKIDTFGKFDGGEFCDDSEYLDGYRFNVAMENYSDGCYFTEKICNCFASRIVPIYWGCPNIGNYFDMDGIIYCQTPEEVIQRVNEILVNPQEEYNKRLKAIEENYNRVEKYRSYSQWFLEMYCELLEEIAR